MYVILYKKKLPSQEIPYRKLNEMVSLVVVRNIALQVVWWFQRNCSTHIKMCVQTLWGVAHMQSYACNKCGQPEKSLQRLVGSLQGKRVLREVRSFFPADFVQVLKLGPPSGHFRGQGVEKDTWARPASKCPTSMSGDLKPVSDPSINDTTARSINPILGPMHSYLQCPRVVIWDVCHLLWKSWCGTTHTHWHTCPTHS